MSEAIEPNAEPDVEPDVEKVNIRFAGDAMKKLREAARKRGVTINEFVRRAVGTEVFLLEEIDKGSHILVEDKNARTREILLR